MAPRSHALGIDFGTSNSAAGYADNGIPRLVTMDNGQRTLPTTFFFDFESRKTLIGEPANAALLDGADGRFMRALKRVLGTSLMHEKRQILNERVTFVDIIGRFLGHLKMQAEAEADHSFSRVVSGRPVVFHGADDPREAQAEADLRACYHAAGFVDVSFLPEPEAAAIAAGATETPGEIGLVVDIGGGTSDFSLFRVGNAGVTILANHGVRIGGTDFDRAISIAHVMPLLGKGGELRKLMGPGRTPVPHAIFHKLATWEEIPFLYTAQNQRMVDEMVHLAIDNSALKRLATVLENHLGHDLAFAVEAAKIDANSDKDNAAIALDTVEKGLSAPLTRAALDAALTAFGDALRDGVTETLALAEADPATVTRVIYVGGSSLMSLVSNAVSDVLPNAQHSYSEVFTAVADGLALAAARD